MKAFDRCFALLAALTAAAVALLYILLAAPNSTSGRQYRVDVHRAAQYIQSEGFDSLELADYPTLTAITPVNPASLGDLTAGSSDYLILDIDGALYRFEYTAGQQDSGFFAAAVIVLLISAMCAAIMLYIRRRILRPFYTLSEVPYELSRGNLTVPLTETKHKFFGRFIWGMDALRENLEQHKQTELSLLSERKKLILSLSHDIKIPLSAIKLYAAALSRNLYDSEEKKREIADSINRNADEIEKYVSGIVKASREDFLELEVRDGEFYLSELENSLRTYYAEKLRLVGTRFDIEPFGNCLIRGDCDRAVEALQNIMENAIKYGDGKYIRISCCDDEDAKLITIANSGCSLPESELAHIFESFWRGTNAPEGSGSGLGLYICRSLINKMGGEVYAEIADGEMRVTVALCKA